MILIFKKFTLYKNAHKIKILNLPKFYYLEFTEVLTMVNIHSDISLCT